jgi:hypothetical protein
MAFGFPASYTNTVDLTGSRQDAREAVRAVLDLLGWPYVEQHADRFVATVPMSGSSWGETVTITLESPAVARVNSACRFLQLFDWGKNKRNVDVFIERFSLREVRYAKTSDDPKYFDSEGKTPLDRALVDGVSGVDEVSEGNATTETCLKRNDSFGTAYRSSTTKESHDSMSILKSS